MLARISKAREFVVDIADIENNNALTTGKTQPLPGHSVSGK
jgi:hypothetical protein